MLKLLDSEKTYKLRVKEDSEIFHKVLLTFDGTEGGPNTYLKFRDKKVLPGLRKVIVGMTYLRIPRLIILTLITLPVMEMSIIRPEGTLSEEP